MSRRYNRARVKTVAVYIYSFYFEILLVQLMIYPFNSHRYPYEAIHVITANGYVLLLERIPR